jgi:hypothetical protein
MYEFYEDWCGALVPNIWMKPKKGVIENLRSPTRPNWLILYSRMKLVLDDEMGEILPPVQLSPPLGDARLGVRSCRP